MDGGPQTQTQRKHNTTHTDGRKHNTTDPDGRGPTRPSEAGLEEVRQVQDKKGWARISEQHTPTGHMT